MSLRDTIRHNDALRQALAAEYVLRTLKHGARRRFETWLRDDKALQGAVAQWQQRLNAMAEFAAEVQPPVQVWNRIARRLEFSTVQKKSDSRSFWLGLREDLAFWRGLGLVSTALASVLVMVLVAKQPDTVLPAVSYVATLSNDKAQPVLLVTSDPKRHELIVKVIASQPLTAEQTLQLWAIPKSGTPRSLGLIASNSVDGVVRLPLPAGTTPDATPVLAVSLEAKGGSRNPNGPTGPVLFTGALLQI